MAAESVLHGSAVGSVKQSELVLVSYNLIIQITPSPSLGIIHSFLSPKCRTILGIYEQYNSIITHLNNGKYLKGCKTSPLQK